MSWTALLSASVAPLPSMGLRQSVTMQSIAFAVDPKNCILLSFESVTEAYRVVMVVMGMMSPSPDTNAANSACAAWPRNRFLPLCGTWYLRSRGP